MLWATLSNAAVSNCQVFLSESSDTGRITARVSIKHAASGACPLPEVCQAHVPPWQESMPTKKELQAASNDH